MDPNANRSALMRAARELLEDLDSETDLSEEIYDRADEICTLVLSLDNWILSGGFLPDAWSIANPLYDRHGRQIREVTQAEIDWSP